MKPSQPIGDYLDALVHPSARQDALAAARHRAFIAPRLVVGLCALAFLPIFLALGGLDHGPRAHSRVVDDRSDRDRLLSVANRPLRKRPSHLGDGPRRRRDDGRRLLRRRQLGCRRLAGADPAGSGGIGIAPRGLDLGGARTRGGGPADASSAPVDAIAQASEVSTLAGLGLGSALLYGTAIAFGAERIARADARLRAAEEERARLLTGNMSDVITRHGADGRVLSASANAQEVLGIGAGDLVGLGLVDRIVMSDRAAFRDAIADAAANGVERSVEFRIHRPKLGDDGCFPWIAMHCKPLPESAAAGAVVAVLRDVSAKKAQQQELVDARADAERSNAGKNRFLAVVSHELRTPLNAIIGFSEMLADADEMRIDNARRKEYARLINEAGGHLLGVVNGILDVTRLETGDFQIVPETFEPAAVIAGCCDLLALKAKSAGVALHSRLPSQLPQIVADPRALKQIVINLVANALKFTNRGGTVTIDAAVEGPSLVVTVADTGIGIAPEHFGRSSAIPSSRCAAPMRAATTAAGSVSPSSRG